MRQLRVLAEGLLVAFITALAVYELRHHLVGGLLVGILVCGLGIAVIALIEHLRGGRRHHVWLDARIREGNRLRRQLLETEPSAQARTAADSTVREWRDETERGLKRRVPQWAGTFMNYDAGHRGSAHTTYDKGALDEPLCLLDDHMHQLDEIVKRVDS